MAAGAVVDGGGGQRVEGRPARAAPYHWFAAAAAHPDARPFLVTLDAVPPSRPMPNGLTWAPAARWLLEEM